jgi:hypothetical protein
MSFIRTCIQRLREKNNLRNGAERGSSVLLKNTIHNGTTFGMRLCKAWIPAFAGGNDTMRIIWRAVCPDCQCASHTVIPAEAGIQETTQTLNSCVYGHDATRSDEGREPDGVVPLPMCLAHRHTRGGGYPEDGISLEIVYLRA